MQLFNLGQKQTCTVISQKCRDKVVKSFGTLNVPYKLPIACSDKIDDSVVEENFVLYEQNSGFVISLTAP